jgi:serine protease Do
MIQGFGEIAERLRRSTVRIVHGGGRREASGSGVIWRSDGLILTNAHVARGDRPKVELWDGRECEGEVRARDARRDLAAVRIGIGGLPAATTADSTRLRPGELVVAVGNPLGFIGALTTGVVHALGPLRGHGRQSWVHAAIRLAPGNSGGPLADASGRVVGLNTMIATGGLALAVPSNAVAQFLERDGSRAQLGVVVRPVPLRNRGALGLLILEVSADGPANAASLLMGDVLTGANGRSFESLDDLSDALESGHGVLSLQFLRGDRNVEREVAVRLFEQGAAA